jgi:CubicO group peptidase (beta-lactamase class C family)
MGLLRAYRPIALGLAVCLVATAGWARGRRTGGSRHASKLEMSVDSVFADLDREGSPGVAVLISDGGKTVFQKCLGLASVENSVPITPATRFNLASASKQFTAAAVLLVEEEGLLSQDDDIRLYMPELPDLGSPITISNLIHQTSGLWDYWQVLQFVGFARWDYLNVDQMLTLMEHQEELKFEPGTRWDYCNSNYTLLAQIVERVTGQPFDRWTTEHIFKPLGMADTRFYSDCFELIPDVAVPYERAGDGFKSGRLADVAFAGQGHAYSTIGDMALWFDALRTGRIGGPGFVEKMYAKGKLNNGDEVFYAAGLGVRDYRGVKTVGHTGQTGGFKSAMLYCPDLGIGVVVLANLGSVNVENSVEEVLDAYLGDRLEPEAEAQATEEAPFIEVDPAIYDRYQGSYEIEGAPIVVSAFRAGDNLIGAMSGEGMAYIYPVSETKFMTSHRRVSIEFLPEGSGEVKRILLDVEGQEMWADRMEDTVTDDAAAEYAGTYYSDALGMVYSVSVEEGELQLSHRRVGTEETLLLYAGPDAFASGFGFIYFTRDEDGAVDGFKLSHEFLGDGTIRFEKMLSLR